MKEENKKKLKISNLYLVDVSIFLVILCAFVFSLLLLLNSLNAFQIAQQNIASTLLTFQQNDSTVSSFKKSDLSKSNIEKALPDQNSIINWVVQLETISKDIGVAETLSFNNATLTKDGIVVQQLPGLSGPPAVTANITLKGKYSQIISFVDMLNHSFYYTRVESMSFSSNRSVDSISPTPTVIKAATSNQPVSASLVISLFIGNTTNAGSSK